MVWLLVLPDLSPCGSEHHGRGNQVPQHRLVPAGVAGGSSGGELQPDHLGWFVWCCDFTK